MKDASYQYAVKVIQGGIKAGIKTQPIGPGIYFTSVNVHNPWRHEVKYAVKLAVSGHNGMPKPGTISPFQGHVLGPDEVTEYDHKGFTTLLGTLPAFLESYFVIESEEELDVVGVYTGAAVQDGHLGAMHMERVPARIVPRCGDLNMDISTGVADWRLTAVEVGSTSPMLIGPAPLSNPRNDGWVEPTDPAKWLGTSGTPGPSSTAHGVVAGEYTYELSFCLCPTFCNAKTDLTLWADNEAKLFLNGLLIAATVDDYAYQGDGLSVAITTDDAFIIGQNKLTVVVTNNEPSTGKSSTGMLLKGTLSADAADCGS